LWFSDRADHAVVNAYPDLCRKLKAGWASGLANAVLRKASRIDAATAFADYPDAVRWSLPDWLWQQWQSDWPDQAAAMAEASLTPPPLTLRVNQRHHHRDHWLTQFGDEARAGALSP
ncbi:hypothetical protein MY522_22285, partial [Thalassospira xiamenensis]|nr:hypothetical protein [Thalassospira xiamenensis]